MAGRFSVEAVFKAIDKVTAPVSRMQDRVGKFTRSASAGFRRLNKSVNTFGRGVKAAAGTGLRALGVGITGLTVAAIGLITQFSKIENAEAAFTPLLGGAEKAKRAVQALNDTAATTPFQFETLASSANQLLPVMNGNIERTIKTVRMLGDTAGGNAQKLDSITRGFTKAMLKGKVDMESLNMIAEAGVPIFTELADSMGKKVNASFFKMISAGKVTTVQLTKAFEKMTSKGGVFFDGMVIASRTTTGMFSTLKDNISLTAAELGSVLAPTVKDLIGQSTKIAQKIREWVKQNREVINTRFVSFVDTVKESVKRLATTFTDLNSRFDFLTKLEQAITLVVNLTLFLQRNGQTILKVMAVLAALVVGLKTFIAVMTAVNLVMALNPIGLITLGVIAAIAAFTALVVWIDEVSAGFEKMPALVQLLLTPLGLVIKAIKFIKDNFGTISAAAGAVGRFVGFGGEEEGQAAGPAPMAPEIVSPQARTAGFLTESRTTNTSELTIKDETGRAEITAGPLGSGITLARTGAF